MTFIQVGGYTFVNSMALADQHMATQLLDRFCVAGINYQSAGTEVRGKYSVTKEDFVLIAIEARAANLRSVFVLSTCNRTEIYGFADDVSKLAQLLVAHAKGDMSEFLQYAYLRSGEAAVDHLMKVASGLDSQILGDYEILGQLKQAVDTATAQDMIGPVMNRTLNYAFQASKKIKTETSLSTGTVSVSYAAIELLKEYPRIEEKKILVIGAGKFSGNVCGNLVKYLPGVSVTVTNRTDEHAMNLAQRAGLAFQSYIGLSASIQEADIIIVCTNANEPTVLPEHFTDASRKLILDLSVPVNVHPNVKQLSQIKVIDVDEISTSILDKTFTRRKLEVPKAEQIILHYKKEYQNWLLEYRYSLHIKSWKDKLQELDEWQPQYCEMAGTRSIQEDERKVQKAVTRLAVNLRTNQEKGCQFINAINDYLQMS